MLQRDRLTNTALSWYGPGPNLAPSSSITILEGDHNQWIWHDEGKVWESKMFMQVMFWHILLILRLCWTRSRLWVVRSLEPDMRSGSIMNHIYIKHPRLRSSFRHQLEIHVLDTPGGKLVIWDSFEKVCSKKLEKNVEKRFSVWNEVQVASNHNWGG